MNFDQWSRSQRHFFCKATDLPTDLPTTQLIARISAYIEQHELSELQVYTAINIMRQKAQRHAEAINSTTLRDPKDGVSTINMLKRFSTFELTQLAYKLRLPRTFCTRVFIADEIAELAKIKTLTFPALFLLLREGEREPC